MPPVGGVAFSVGRAQPPRRRAAVGTVSYLSRELDCRMKTCG
jgi:hypothetical protein